MNKQLVAVAIVCALFASSSVTAAPPDPRTDFGDSNFGLEPDPPSADPQPPELDDEVISSALEIVFSNVQPGDEFVIGIPENPIEIKIPDEAVDPPTVTEPKPLGLVLRVLGDASTQTLELPALTHQDVPVPDDGDPTIPELDFTLLLTAATAVIDRAGANPPTPPSLSDFDPLQTVDATLQVWGNIGSFGDIGKPDTPTVQTPAPDALPEPEVDPTGGGITKPDTATVEAILHTFVATDPDIISDIIAVDPEDHLDVGDPATIIQDTISTSTIYSTATTIEGALGPLVEDGVSLDGVLATLESVTSDPLGIVDLTPFSQALQDNGFSLEVIETVSGLEPRTIIDKDLKKLAIVDGGFGDITLLADPTKFVFDNDLVTALKDPESVRRTAFHMVAGDALGSVEFDPTLGGYAEKIADVQELAKRGATVEIVESLSNCDYSASGATLCIGAAEDVTVSPAVARQLAKPLPDATLPPVSNLNDILPAAPTDIVGNAFGGIKDLPDLGNALAAGSVAWGMVDVANDRLADFDFGDFTLPGEGLGSFKEFNSLDPDAPDLGQAIEPASLVDFNLLDGMFEAFQAPAMPNMMSIVPMDAATNAASLVTDAAGNGFATMPLDLLKALPLSQTAEEVLRFVGEKGSVRGPVGISGVVVEMTSSDPFGLSSTTSTSTSNPNGYASFALPALGQYDFVARHDDYQDQSGSGQAPAPGGKGGQEFTMSSASGNAAADFVGDNSLFLIAGVLALGIVVYLVATGKIKLPKKGGR